MGRFYLQSNTARIVPSTLTINGMSHYSGPTGIALGQLDEEFRGGVFDTPALKDAAFGVEDAKNTVSVDSAMPSPYGQPAVVCLTTLGCGSRFR
jgi:hypothetical protein